MELQRIKGLVEQVVEPKLKELRISDYEVSVKPGSTRGDNYLSVINEIEIKGKDENGENVTLNWIGKTSHQDLEFRKVMDTYLVFGRELMMYSLAFPTFKAIQEEHNISDPFTGVPNLIASSLDDMSEIIVLENMKKLGFYLLDRQETVNYETAKLVMRQYGKYHAISYALQDQKPEFFAKLKESMQGNVFRNTDKDKFNESHWKPTERLINTLDPIKDAKEIKLLESVKGKHYDIFLKLYIIPEKGAVLTHGDCWINNMLFKNESGRGLNAPTKVCFLDFQLSCIASPVLDLSYFLFANTDKKLREEHFEDLLKEYYLALHGHTIALGTDPEEFLTFEELKAQMKEYSGLGLLISLMLITLVCSDAEEIPDFTDMSNNDPMLFETKHSKKINDRTKGVIRDFVRFGFQLPL